MLSSNKIPLKYFIISWSNFDISLTDEKMEELIVSEPQKAVILFLDNLVIISCLTNCFFSKRASLILLLPISTINFKKLNFIKSTKKSQYYMIRFFFLHVKKSIKFAPLTTRYLSSVGRAMDWKSMCPWFDSWRYHKKQHLLLLFCFALDLLCIA